MTLLAQLGACSFVMTSVLDEEPAVPVAGEFEGDRPLRSFPHRMVVQMADEDRDAPIVGNRLIKVVVPHGLIVCRTSVFSGEHLFQRPVVFDKLIQSIDGPLQQDVLATDE